MLAQDRDQLSRQAHAAVQLCPGSLQEVRAREREGGALSSHRLTIVFDEVTPSMVTPLTISITTLARTQIAIPKR